MTYIDNIKEKNLSYIMRDADAFPMDKIVERYAKDNNIDIDTARMHERELKRFLSLSIVCKSPIGMRGPVDELWHTFITFTVEYEKFCNQVAGHFIHHVPTDESSSPEAMRESVAAFDELYADVFGHEPPIEAWPKTEAKCSSCTDCITCLVKKDHTKILDRHVV